MNTPLPLTSFKKGQAKEGQGSALKEVLRYLSTKEDIANAVNDLRIEVTAVNLSLNAIVDSTFNKEIEEINTASRKIRQDIATLNANFNQDIVAASSDIRRDIATVNANFNQDIVAASIEIRQDIATMNSAFKQDIVAASSEIRQDIATMNSIFKQDIVAASSEIRQDIATMTASFHQGITEINEKMSRLPTTLQLISLILILTFAVTGEFFALLYYGISHFSP